MRAEELIQPADPALAGRVAEAEAKVAEATAAQQVTKAAALAAERANNEAIRALGAARTGLAEAQVATAMEPHRLLAWARRNFASMRGAVLVVSTDGRNVGRLWGRGAKVRQLERVEWRRRGWDDEPGYGWGSHAPAHALGDGRWRSWGTGIWQEVE